jgi:copper oxidase (laccase) domain-containing protein
MASEATTATMDAPQFLAGTWAWRASTPSPDGAVEVLFTGRGPWADRRQVLASCAPEAPPPAWARQVHSARVLPACPGECGEGDALVAGGAEVALSVVTADCVPVLLAGPEGIAAVHAGWRGIASGVIPATLLEISRQLVGRPAGGATEGGASGDSRGGSGSGTGSGADGGGSSVESAVADLSRWRAWVGPAIGPCCYEVGEEVAAQVVAASGPEVAAAGARGRPHLDLQAAARRQLSAAGVGEIKTLPLCTRCRADWLYSFRREGRGAGRNMAFVWRKPRGERSKARS